VWAVAECLACGFAQPVPVTAGRESVIKNYPNSQSSCPFLLQTAADADPYSLPEEYVSLSSLSKNDSGLLKLA